MLPEIISGLLPETDKVVTNMRDAYLAVASDPRVQNAVSELYRSTVSIGDGGTAAALRYAIESGGALKHLQKSADMTTHLIKLLETNTLNWSNSQLVVRLINNLVEAMGRLP